LDSDAVRSRILAAVGPDGAAELLDVPTPTAPR
jgi:hypothetical protein